MMYFFYIFLIAVLFWFGGIIVAYYHANKYKMPGDSSLKAFWAFFIFAGIGFLWVIYFVTNAIWGS